MKNLLKLTILFLVGFVSCQKYVPAVEVEVEPVLDELVTVSFNPTYDNATLVAETPLVKADEPVENNALYGIQIREYVNENSIHSCVRYCYGLYDDISLLTISFRRNHKYFIIMQYYPNGKKDLPYETDGYSPITVHDGKPKLNTIYYSQDTGMDALHSAPSTFCDVYTYWNESFYAKENSAIPIHFYRMNASVTFEFEKVEGNDYEEVVVRGYEKTYTLGLNGESNEIVIDNIPFSISTWGIGLPETKKDMVSIGTRENPTQFFYGEIELKRNTMRTYMIKLENNIVTNSVSVSYDDGELRTENCGYLN